MLFKNCIAGCAKFCLVVTCCKRIFLYLSKDLPYLCQRFSCRNFYVLHTVPMNDLLCFCCWSGYELEVSDLKIEGISDDGEIEFLEEEEDDYDEESYNRYSSADCDDGSVEPNEIKKTMFTYQTSVPQSSAPGSSVPLYRQPLRVSSKYSINVKTATLVKCFHLSHLKCAALIYDCT